MLFNSLEFLLFFPVALFLFFATPHKYRWALLLGASYYFYMCWKAEYVIILFISTLINYWVGIKMGEKKTPEERKPYLVLSLVTCLGTLFVFKYFNFFTNSFTAVLNEFNIFYGWDTFDLILPIGISFYTFQSIGYAIDVYRGKQEPERHFGIFSLYISFFPQLVAGPIERAKNLLPQFRKKVDFDYERVTDGLKLMAWGFFKKVVIADRLAVIVDQVYSTPTEYTGVPLIVATYCFAFQIFCDFSGYSDIAIGASKVMGIKLMNNFERPYFSRNIAEFWTRWHISLSSWLKDYLYIPLGGNQVSRPRWCYNILVVFLLGGLWHGANWTFVIWGGLHALYRIFGIWTQEIRTKAKTLTGLSKHKNLDRVISTLITFHLVVLAWVFFRANSVSDAVYIISHLFVGLEFKGGYNLGVGYAGFLILLISVGILLIVQALEKNESIANVLRSKPMPLRWAAYHCLIMWVVVFSVFDGKEFIYFQF